MHGGLARICLNLDSLWSVEYVEIRDPISRRFWGRKGCTTRKKNDGWSSQPSDKAFEFEKCGLQTLHSWAEVKGGRVNWVTGCSFPDF